MAELFASGFAADLVLGVLLVEAAALFLMKRRGVGPGLAPLSPFLVAGACLALALRAALTGAPWWCIAAALGGSGVAHAVDLARRFRR